MRLFIHSADIGEVKDAIETGLVEGVSTNTSLLKEAAEKKGFEDVRKYLKELMKLAGENLPVSLQVTTSSFEEMTSEADRLAKYFKKYKNLVVKVPVCTQGFDSFRAMRYIASQGIVVNATLVMTPEQALLAARAGASYVTLGAGKIDDRIRTSQAGMIPGRDFEKNDYFDGEGLEDFDDSGIASGVDLAWKTVEIFKTYNLGAKVVASCIRNSRQVREMALAGVHVSDVSIGILSEMASHPETAEGVDKSEHDALQQYKELLKDNRKFAVKITK